MGFSTVKFVGPIPPWSEGGPPPEKIYWIRACNDIVKPRGMLCHGILVAKVQLDFEHNGHDIRNTDQRTNGPVNAHLISWPSKAQNIQNQENIW